METVIGFRGDAGNLKKEIQEVDSMQRQIGVDTLNRTLEEGRQKTKSAKDLLDYVKEEQRIKQSNIGLDRQAADQEAKNRRDTNRQELGGAKISIRDDNRIEDNYREDLAANQEQEKLAKENLVLQNAQLEELKKLGREESYTPEGQERLKQSNIMSGTGEEGYSTAVGQAGLPGGKPSAMGGMMGKFGAMLGAAAIGMMAFNYGKTALTTAVSAETQEEYDIRMLEAVPLIGEFLALGKMPHYQAKKAWRKEAATGYGLLGFEQNRMGWGNKYGYSSTELAGEYQNLSRGVGYVPSSFEDIISSRKAFGFAGGESIGLAKLGAYDESGYGNTMGLMTSQIMSGELNRLKASNVLKAVTSTAQQQGGNLSTVDTGSLMGISLALGNVGGGFGDERLGGLLSTMNQSLANPSTDFQKANRYRVLAGLESTEGMDWTELKIAKQKGLAQEGMLGATVKDAITRGGGSRTLSVENLENAIGVDTSRAAEIYKAMQDDPAMFDNIKSFSSESEMKEAMKWWEKEGQKATSIEDKQAAETREKLIDSAMDAAMDKLSKGAVGQAIIKIGNAMEKGQKTNVLPKDLPHEIVIVG